MYMRSTFSAARVSPAKLCCDQALLRFTDIIRSDRSQSSCRDFIFKSSEKLRTQRDGDNYDGSMLIRSSRINKIADLVDSLVQSVIRTKHVFSVIMRFWVQIFFCPFNTLMKLVPRFLASSIWSLFNY